MSLGEIADAIHAKRCLRDFTDFDCAVYISARTTGAA